jgi:hypothetical protein
MPEKTPQELIDELDAISRTARPAGLLIAFPKKSLMLRGTDPDRLETLTHLIRSGGKPLAWFGVYEDGLRFQLLPECQGQEWAKRALEHIIKRWSDTRDDPPAGSN